VTTTAPGKIINLLPKTVAKAAEFYASQFGWRVFPLYEMSPSGVCSCSKGGECRVPGKHPRVSIPSGENAVHPGTSNVEQIRAWWKKWPEANIGIWLEGSNVLVLDIDKNDKKDGFKGLADIMAYEKQTALPPTLVCKTPSGGEHHYFKLCEGVPNKANSLGPGLDTWHSGHYVIVPPSNHVKGIYDWVGDASDILDYPEWLKPRSRQPDAAPAKRGRPAKEHLDIGDPDEVARLAHALKFVDNSNRDLWVSVGFAIARAFDWSEAGFQIYDEWSCAAHNYDEKKTREQYFKQSKVVPRPRPSPPTQSSNGLGSTPITKAGSRPTTGRTRSVSAMPTTFKCWSISETSFMIFQFTSADLSLSRLFRSIKTEASPTEELGFPKDLMFYERSVLCSWLLESSPTRVRWMRKSAKGWRATSVNIALCSAFLDIGNWPKAHKLRAFVQHPTLRDDGTLLTASRL
jgi:hypothetical protein